MTGAGASYSFSFFGGYLYPDDIKPGRVFVRFIKPFKAFLQGHFKAVGM